MCNVDDDKHGNTTESDAEDVRELGNNDVGCVDNDTSHDKHILRDTSQSLPGKPTSSNGRSPRLAADDTVQLDTIRLSQVVRTSSSRVATHRVDSAARRLGHFETLYKLRRKLHSEEKQLALLNKQFDEALSQVYAKYHPRVTKYAATLKELRDETSLLYTHTAMLQFEEHVVSTPFHELSEQDIQFLCIRQNIDFDAAVIAKKQIDGRKLCTSAILRWHA